MLEEEFGDRDEVDKEEDSIGPLKSITPSALNECGNEVLLDVEVFDEDGRFFKGIVDEICLLSIVIAVSQLQILYHNNLQRFVTQLLI